MIYEIVYVDYRYKNIEIINYFWYVYVIWFELRLKFIFILYIIYFEYNMYYK